MSALRRHPSAAEAERRGFALLVVLWVVLGVVTLTFGAIVMARRTVAAARNDRDYLRAMWNAEDCIERLRGALDAAVAPLGGRIGDTSAAVWDHLDLAVAASPLLAGRGCDVTLHPSGLTLDVATASDDIMRRALRAIAGSDARGDSLTDALLDWQDADDEPRTSGAERSWYLEQRRLPPRNAPITDVGELRFVHGFDALEGIDSLLGSDSGRITIDRAPLVIVGALPGMTAEAVDHVAWHRMLGEPIMDLAALASELSPAARDSLLGNLDALQRVATVDPEEWVATSVGHAPSSRVAVAFELLLGRAGPRIAILRRRVRWQ